MKVAILIVTIWRNEFEARHFQLHKLDERRERMEDEHWARDEQEDEMRLRMVAREGRHWRQRSAEERARQEEQAKMIRRMIAIEERSLVLRRTGDSSSTFATPRARHSVGRACNRA